MKRFSPIRREDEVGEVVRPVFVMRHRALLALGELPGGEPALQWQSVQAGPRTSCHVLAPRGNPQSIGGGPENLEQKNPLD